MCLLPLSGLSTERLSLGRVGGHCTPDPLKNEMMPIAATGMDLEIILLSEARETGK